MSTRIEPVGGQLARHQGDVECRPLMAAADVDLFRKNAFRITGLPVDATPREASHYLDELKMAVELGHGFQKHVPAYPLPKPPGLDEIREAVQKLKDPETRLIDEFFWFWPEKFGESKSDLAILALSAGDSQKAIELWEVRSKAETNGVVARHNLAVVYHLISLEAEYAAADGQQISADRLQRRIARWKSSVRKWGRLAREEEMWGTVAGRIRQLNEPALTTGFVRRLRASFPLALAAINVALIKNLALAGSMDVAKELVAYVREQSPELRNFDHAAEQVLATERNRLKSQIQRSRDNTKENPRVGHKEAESLIDNALPLLELFDLFFGEAEHFQKEIFDDVASTAVGCVVEYQRNTGDNQTFVRVLERAMPLADSLDVRKRIEANISIGKSNLRGKELEPVYALLKSIQESKDSPSAKLAGFKRDAIPALNKATGISGFSENYGYLSASAEDFKELFDSAAIVLRSISLDAWNNHHDRQTAVAANDLAIKHATSPEIKQRLAEDKRSLQQMRYEADLKPITAAPSLSTINGIGFKLYGSSDTDPTNHSYLSTYYFVFFFIPVFPICRYRVTSSGDSYRFFGKAPLRKCDKWHLAISIALIIWFIIYICSADGSSSRNSGYIPPSSTRSASGYSSPSAIPRPSPYTPPSTYDASGSGGNVYQVPSTVSSSLEREKEEIESDRATLEALEAQIEKLGREIESDRLYLDRTSQYSVDAFNEKVDRYNVLLQKNKEATTAFKIRVDNYNARLRTNAR